MTDLKHKLAEKLNLETAMAPWHELQIFFAQGLVLHVKETLDLLVVAEELTLDNSKQFQVWLSNGDVEKVSVKNASLWFEADTKLWTVVIKPWVLVQEDIN